MRGAVNPSTADHVAPRVRHFGTANVFLVHQKHKAVGLGPVVPARRETDRAPGPESRSSARHHRPTGRGLNFCHVWCQFLSFMFANILAAAVSQLLVSVSGSGPALQVMQLTQLYSSFEPRWVLDGWVCVSVVLCRGSEGASGNRS